MHAAGIDSRRALRSFSDGSTVVTAGGTSKLRRERSQEEQQSPPKNYCNFIGIFFLIAGISGFVPALAPSPADGAMLFGIFMVGPVHNIIHLASGAAALFCAFAGAGATRKYFQIFGVVYLLVALIGFAYGNSPSWE